MNNQNKKYCQIRLSFNLNEKEDMEVYSHFVEDRQKPSKNIILALYNQLNTESIIINRLDHLEFVLKNLNNVSIQQVEEVKDDLNLSLDFSKLDITDFEFLD